MRQALEEAGRACYRESFSFGDALMAQRRTRRNNQGEPRPMENPETKRPSTPKQSPSHTGLQLSEAYLKLGRGLYDGALESRKRLSEAATSFVTAKHQLEQETAKRATEAYRAYANTAQESRTKENAQELLAE